MTQTIIDFLRHIPFWAWVIFPALLLGLITYFVSDKNLRISIIVVVIALVSAWGAAGFHLWENYLSNHFIGTYDEYGIPYKFSGHGWRLMLRGWPIWVVPTFLALAIALLIKSYISFTSKHQYPRFRRSYAVSQESSGKAVAKQLQTEKLKRALAAANDELMRLGHRRIETDTAEPSEADIPYEEQGLIARLEDEIKGLKAEVTSLIQQKKQLKERMEKRDLELSRAKTMLKSLLQK